MRSEKATTWTAGLSLAPTGIPGLTAAIDYFSIRFKDRILQATSDFQAMLVNEDELRDLIVRNPSLQDLEQICSGPRFFGDPSLCTPDFVAAIVDFRTKNIAESNVKGVDISAAYSRPLAWGTIALGSSATYLMDYKIRISPSAPLNEQVDNLERPVDFRARSYLSLASGGTAGTLTLNYADSYKNTSSALQERIGSYATADLNVTSRFDYRLRPAAEGPFSVSFSIVNLFNTAPPFVDNFLGYDGINTDPLGRLASLEVRFRW